MDMRAAPTRTDTGDTEYTEARADDAAREIRGVDVEHTKNGGFTARCSYKQPEGKNAPYLDSEMYAFSTIDELTNFLRTQWQAPAAAAPADDVVTEQ